MRLARQPQPFTLPLQLTPPVDGDAFVDELGGDLVGVEGGGEVDVFGEAEVGELAAGGAGEKRGEQVGVGRFEGGDGGGGFGGAGSGEVGGDGAGAEEILQGGAQRAVGPAFAGGDDGEWTAQDPGPGADGGQVAKAASQDVAAGTSFDGDGGAVGRREDEARGRWIPRSVQEDDGGPSDGRRHGGGEGEDVDDDEGPAVGQRGDSLRAPFAPHIERSLIGECHFQRPRDYTWQVGQ